MLSFFVAVLQRLRPTLKVAYNTAVPLDNTGALTAAWFRRVAPYVDYLTIENWMTPAAYIRKSGTEWWNNWDGWREPHKVCVAAGVGFLPISTRRAQAYSLATFLLDTDGRGCHIWTATDGYVDTVDPWTPEYEIARNLGAPLEPATRSGNVSSRPFQSGHTVTVDPVAGTALIG